MKRLLKRMLDETEFLRTCGIRAFSRASPSAALRLQCRRHGPFGAASLPAESNSGVFGGNSNWRGPIWFPVNFLLIESLQNSITTTAMNFRIECPTAPGSLVSLNEAAREITRRLTRIFLKDARASAQFSRSTRMIQQDAHFRDYLLFHEYFDGDSGRGVGTSHQTGWTGFDCEAPAAPREPPEIAMTRSINRWAA